jgi:hypothetical protein
MNCIAPDTYHARDRVSHHDVNLLARAPPTG